MAELGPISAFGDEIAPDLEEQLAILLQHGVAALELRSAWGVKIVDLDSHKLGRAARLLESEGIAVSAIGSPVGKAPVDGDFDTELARLGRAFHAAERLRTRLVRVFSFFIPEGRHREFRDEVLQRMSAFAREAEARDLVLVHENEGYIYGDDGERCRDLVESVGSPALRLAFDPANFVQVGVRPYDKAWPLLAPYVEHFHVKDAVGTGENRPAGEGDGQLKELLGELRRGGYRGYLVVEPHLQFHLPDLEGPQRFGVALEALRGLLGE